LLTALCRRRHCEIVYYQDWHRSTPPTRAKPGNILPAVSPLVTASPPPQPQIRQRGLNPSGGLVIAEHEGPQGRLGGPAGGEPTRPSGGLPFDEEAKLVYGVVLSLRNMVKKLTGRSVPNSVTLSSGCQTSSPGGKMVSSRESSSEPTVLPFEPE
jgi:hypothetical protein